MSDVFKNLQSRARRRGLSLHKGGDAMPFWIVRSGTGAAIADGTVFRSLEEVQAELAKAPHGNDKRIMKAKAKREPATERVAPAQDGFAGPYQFAGADREALEA